MRPRQFHLFPDDTLVLMIIDQPHGLHEGIAGGGANKAPTALGYVLYNDEQDGFMAINRHTNQPRIHYVSPSAWAHRYPYIQLASDAVRNLDEPVEIQALFLIGKRFMAFTV